MVTWEYLDEESKLEKNQETEVANLCLMADTISNSKETEVFSEPPLSYDDLMNTYNELLNDTQIITTQSVTLKKSF